jgi:uncharacterized repeat protein (TIGR01451 family)
MVGQEVTYTVLVQHSGECEALSVIVPSVLPPGMAFKEARAERGQWSFSDGVVTFQLGRMSTGAFEKLEIVARPTLSGLLTNYFTMRSLNEASGALDDNAIEVVIEVLPGAELRLQIDKPAVGPPQIKMTGPAGRSAVLEASTNLIDWVTISSNELIGGSATVVDPEAGPNRQRFYRGQLR